MKIKDLRKDHPRIYELAMLRQKEAGNVANDSIELGNDNRRGGFSWSETVEGLSFWSSIYDKDFQPFYDEYHEDLPIESLTESFNKVEENIKFKDKFIGQVPDYYDNSKGSLYKVATERNWNTYVFDVVKRLERNGKKDPLKQEIEKSIVVLKLWLKELES